MLELPEDIVPLRRPHFELRDDRLFFLLSRRPYAQLDEQDRALWNRIDGATSLAELRRTFPDVEARLQQLHALQSASSRPLDSPPNRRRVLVIEPHMDDAVLSVGGTMWAMRDQCDFTVATIASQSNFTSYFAPPLDREFFDVATVSALRKAESRLVMRLLGGRHVALDLPEAPLRFRAGNWTLDWYRRHQKQVDAFIMHAATDAEIETWTDAILPLLEDGNTDEIWLPLGVGSHADHELARNACLRALNRVGGGPRLRAALYFYQEVPYATQFPAHTPAIVDAITAAGGKLELQTTDVSGSFADKLRLVSVFGSQFKPSYMSPRVEDAARRASPSGDGGGLCEVRFQVTALPGPVDPAAVYSGRDAVERVETRLAPWYARHRDALRIRILSPVPVSRWKDDFASLLEAFPQATFEVHVSEEYADETHALVSPRIDVRPVLGREVAWLARLVAIALSRPRPTILLTGEGLRGFADVATRIFVLSDALAITRMNHFVLALRRITSS